MERNYREDQASEVEALGSIYCGEMEVLEMEPVHKFKISISTEEYNSETDNGLACDLIFTYTEKYPDEAPKVEIEGATNFEDEYRDTLLKHIKGAIELNLGMEMVFSLVSSAQEWLNQRWDEHITLKENEHLRNLQEQEEAELKKFEGTRVNVETFMNWKLKFEEELGIAVRREKALSDGKKLTGKELFLRDNTLNESDIKFLLEAGDSIENVKIDESLFQNIEDLELASEDEHDEDYVPGNDSD